MTSLQVHVSPTTICRDCGEHLPRVPCVRNNLLVADSTAVAITSVVVGGAVAISAPIIAGQLEARREARRLATERRLKDIDELRALLDESAERLHELDNAAHAFSDAIIDALEAAAQPGRARKPALEAHDAFWKVRWSAAPLESRLAIRLGPESAVTNLYEETIVAAEAMVREIADFGWLNSQHDTYESFPKKYESYKKRAATFKALFKRFLDAAKERAGSTA